MLIPLAIAAMFRRTCMCPHTVTRQYIFSYRPSPSSPPGLHPSYRTLDRTENGWPIYALFWHLWGADPVHSNSLRRCSCLRSCRCSSTLRNLETLRNLDNLALLPLLPHRAFMLRYRGPRLILRMAQRLQRTLHALRCPRHTQSSPVIDDLVRVVNPLLSRNHLHQILFNIPRVLRPRKLQPPRDPVHVRIDHDSFGLPEPRSQHHVCRLSRHSRQREQLIHLIGNFAAELLHHLASGPHNGLRLVPEESRSDDHRLQFLRLNLRQRSRCRILLEQRRGHHIYPHVRTLRRKNRRNQQLPGIVMMQSTHRPRIRPIQYLQNLRHPLRSQRIELHRPRQFLCRNLLRCSSLCEEYYQSHRL